MRLIRVGNDFSAFFGRWSALPTQILQHDVSDLFRRHIENAIAEVGQFNQRDVLNKLSVRARVSF
jgi:hypothetical protein